MQKVVADGLDTLLEFLPPRVRKSLCQQPDFSDLLEVILDMGRPPEARFPSREVILVPEEIKQEDIDYVVSRVSQFSGDNRAGIERTLHRISAIRNRNGQIIGLTCRAGRAVFGTIEIIQDLIETEKSVLLLGRPGVGKTTMLREIARVLADDFKKRVIIVDTSNEIAGDGDIPHPAIGHARRMQVASPFEQHAVMIEAVENHMPEVIIIDEIGTELEARAARTIAERGVQLVGTAHGNTLENLIMNPTLSDLIGGIQTVTLGDEEARRRHTRKSILERKAPPTFGIVVELIDREKVVVHSDVSEAVDAILHGQGSHARVRMVDDEGKIIQEEINAPVEKKSPQKRDRASLRLQLFGVNASQLGRIAREQGTEVEVVMDVQQADLFLTTKNYYRHKPQKIRDAEVAGVPIYVMKANSVAQMRQFLSSTAHGERQEMVEIALQEAERGIAQMNNGQQAVDLNPHPAYIRRLQHFLADRHGVNSHSSGKEPNRRVRISRR